MIDVDNALVRKLNRFVPLGPGELAVLAEFDLRRRQVPADTELVYERQVRHHAFILHEGWACAYKLVPNGGRQVINFAIPGDFVGLRSILLRTSDHSFFTLTDALVSEVTWQELAASFSRRPILGTAILWAASREEAMVVEHLVSVGRRSAVERTAHLLIELGHRLELVGLGSRDGYACPLNQYVLSDALGLTAIHLNRILRQLRERRLVTFRDGRVEFHDLPGLKALAEWDSAYLDQDRPLLPD